MMVQRAGKKTQGAFFKVKNIALMMQTTKGTNNIKEVCKGYVFHIRFLHV